jgi:dTDP-4-dehydrorhamnose reductase
VRVAVLGATGQLGTDLVAHFAAAGDDVVALGHGDVRVEAADSVRAALGAARPDAVRPLSAGRPGLYHLACRGSCSWYELARAVFDLLAIDTPLHRARAADFPGPARRPAYSVLDSRRYHALGRGKVIGAVDR